MGWRLILSALSAYTAGSLGYIVSELSVYADGRVYNGAGQIVTVGQMLPEIILTPITNGGFVLALALFSVVVAAFAVWACRWSWHSHASVLAVVVLFVVGGTLVGAFCCLLFWLSFGGWGPPYPLLFVGSFVSAVLCAALLRRRSLLLPHSSTTSPA